VLWEFPHFGEGQGQMEVEAGGWLVKATSLPLRCHVGREDHETTDTLHYTHQLSTTALLPQGGTNC